MSDWSLTRGVVMAEESAEREASWPADLVEIRDQIREELAQREAELTGQRKRYPAGQSGWN